MNDRKEFFQVSLDELEAHLRKRGLQVQLTKLAEAKEYRQTVVLRDEMRRAPAAVAPVSPASPVFTGTPFAQST